MALLTLDRPHFPPMDSDSIKAALTSKRYSCLGIDTYNAEGMHAHDGQMGYEAILVAEGLPVLNVLGIFERQGSEIVTFNSTVFIRHPADDLECDEIMIDSGVIFQILQSSILQLTV